MGGSASRPAKTWCKTFRIGCCRLVEWFGDCHCASVPSSAIQKVRSPFRTQCAESDQARSDKKAVGEDLREVFVTDKKDDSPDKGWKRWEGFVDARKKRYPSRKNYLDKSNYFAYFTYLNHHHKTCSIIYSTNWIERLNRDYKRTLRMRGVMPDSDSVIFLPGKVSMTRTAYDRKVPKLDYEQKRFEWAEKDT